MLSVRSLGRGARRVLALHCTLSHGGAWRALAGQLTNDVTLVAPDLPGHGQSPDWDSQTEYQSACVAALDPFLQKPTDMVAHSFAATVALRVAVEHPQRVRSLFLIEPVFFAAARQETPEGFAENARASQGYIDALERGDMEVAARLFNRLWGDGRPWSQIPERTRNYMIARMPIIRGQTPALTEDCANLLAPGRLEALRVPVLLLRGDQSPEITAGINRALAARIPGCGLSEIEGAGHMAPITHPEAVAAVLRGFLEVA